VSGTDAGELVPGNLRHIWHVDIVADETVEASPIEPGVVPRFASARPSAPPPESRRGWGALRAPG